MTLLVGELCTNHNGDLQRAKDMALGLRFAGFWAVKGQYRTPDPAWKDRDYSDVPYSHGMTYWEHRMAVDLTIEEHCELREYCQSINLEYYVSVWDVPGVDHAADISMRCGSGFIKIPSALNNNQDILNRAAQSGCKIIISIGMLDTPGIVNIIHTLGSSLYAMLVSTCAYPARQDEIHLRRMDYLIGHYRATAWTVGLSGHHLGNVPDLVALGMGAGMIERHITFDHNAKGPDHGMSMDPGELTAYGIAMMAAKASLGDGKFGVLGCEETFAQKVGRIKG